MAKYTIRSGWAAKGAGLMLVGGVFLVVACGPSEESDVRQQSLKQVGQSGAKEIQVQFFQESNMTIPAAIQAQIVSQKPLFTDQGAFDQGRTWRRLFLSPGASLESVKRELRKAENVRIVRDASPVVEPPVTPDMEPNQTYLNAPDDPTNPGFGSSDLWAIDGGTGTGVTVFDLEYRWNFDHEDLDAVDATDLILPAGDTYPPAGFATYVDNTNPMNPIDNTVSFTNHGTAALGVSAATQDGLGTTGMAYGADFKMVPEVTVTNGYNRADSVLRAVANGKPGDVILMEQQDNVCPDAMGVSAGFGPAEWRQEVFDAVEQAVAQGFVVVSAAGNGAVDLDDGDCGDNFDRAVRDSGAIIVGAGNDTSFTKRATSSFGSRVDLHAWGTNVRSLGYGAAYTDPTDPTNPNFWYSNFSGTSSASAQVAGAVAQLQGIIIDKYGVPFNSFQMRDLLVRTGDPQDPAEAATPIGPRINLASASAELLAADKKLDIMFLLDMTGSYADDLPNFQARIPAIIAELQADHDDIQFGLSSFQDYPTLPFGWAGGDFVEQDGSVTPVPADYVYQLHQQLTADSGAFAGAVAAMVPPHVGHGQDGPEAQLDALYQLAAGPVGERAEFRDGATKLILVWTDNSFHLPTDEADDGTDYPGVRGFNEVSQAILALDPPQVIGISSNGGGYTDLAQVATQTNSLAPAGGVDCDGNGTIDIAQGQPLVCVLNRDANAETQFLPEAISALVGVGVQNRRTDLGVTLSLAPGTAVPEYMQVGESVNVAVKATVTNHGPSGPADARLSILTSPGGASSFDKLGLAVNAEGTETISVALSCSDAGQATVALLADVELLAPADSFDGMPSNDMARLTFSTTCLPSLYASKKLDIRNYVTVDRPEVYGGNDFRMGTDATVSGDVSVNGDVSLWSRAIINGDLSYVGSFTAQDGVLIGGETRTGDSFENVQLPLQTVSPGTQDRTVNNGATATWAPGSYRDGLVRARGRVTLTAGVYVFKSLRFEPDAVLNFNTSGGKIIIKVEGALEFGDRMVTSGGSSSTVSFYSGTQDLVRIGTDLTLRASLTVPRGRIHVYSRTRLTGVLWAKEMTFEPQVTIGN